MQKIFLLIDFFPPRAGGMETHAYEFARFLKDQKLFDFRGVIAFPSKEIAVNHESYFPVRPTILPESALTEPSILIDFLKGQGIGANDILFFNTLYWIQLYPSLRIEFPHTIFAQRSGGNDIIQAPISDQGATLRERRSYVCNTINEHIDLLIVTSEYSLRRLARAGIKKSIMHAIVGGVDTERFKTIEKSEKALLRAELHLPGQEYIILDVSRLVPFKGIEYGLRALTFLQKLELDTAIPSWKYVIVGSGPLHYEFEAFVEEHNLSGKVIFAGEVSHEKIQDYYRAADIFCHTPIYFRQKVLGGSYIHTESMGRCLCEATACGLPIVVTHVGGINEIVTSGINGLITKAKKPKAIASTLAVLLGDQKKQIELGVNGREIAEKYFSWEHIFHEYIKLFGSIGKT